MIAHRIVAMQLARLVRGDGVEGEGVVGGLADGKEGQLWVGGEMVVFDALLPALVAASQVDEMQESGCGGQ